MSETETNEAELARLDKIRTGLARHAGLRGIIQHSESQRSVRLLKRIGGETATQFIGGIGSIRAHVAFNEAVDALVSIGNEKALQRLSWIGHDREDLAPQIVEALAGTHKPETLSMIAVLAERNSNVALPALSHLVDLKKIFSDESGIDRCIERAAIAATIDLTVASEDEFKGVLQRAVETLPALAEQPNIVAAMEKLGLTL